MAQPQATFVIAGFNAIVHKQFTTEIAQETTKMQELESKDITKSLWPLMDQEFTLKDRWCFVEKAGGISSDFGEKFNYLLSKRTTRFLLNIQCKLLCNNNNKNDDDFYYFSIHSKIPKPRNEQMIPNESDLKVLFSINHHTFCRNLIRSFNKTKPTQTIPTRINWNEKEFIINSNGDNIKIILSLNNGSVEVKGWKEKDSKYTMHKFEVFTVKQKKKKKNKSISASPSSSKPVIFSDEKSPPKIPSSIHTMSINCIDLFSIIHGQCSVLQRGKKLKESIKGQMIFVVGGRNIRESYNKAQKTAMFKDIRLIHTGIKSKTLQIEDIGDSKGIKKKLNDDTMSLKGKLVGFIRFRDDTKSNDPFYSDFPFKRSNQWNINYVAHFDKYINYNISSHAAFPKITDKKIINQIKEIVNGNKYTVTRCNNNPDLSIYSFYTQYIANNKNTNNNNNDAEESKDDSLSTEQYNKLQRVVTKLNAMKNYIESVQTPLDYKECGERGVAECANIHEIFNQIIQENNNTFYDMQ